MTRFMIGDEVTISRRRCGSITREPGAVWQVVGINRDTGEVSVRSPGGFTLEVAASLLAPVAVADVLPFLSAVALVTGMPTERPADVIEREFVPEMTLTV